MRRVQHNILDGLGVGLLVRGHQHFFSLPTAGRGDVLHRITFPFRRPLPPNRMPHPAMLRADLRQLERPPQPVIEQMTIARLRRVLGRRENDRGPPQRIAPVPCPATPVGAMVAQATMVAKSLSGRSGY